MELIFDSETNFSLYLSNTEINKKLMVTWKQLKGTSLKMLPNQVLKTSLDN